MATASNAQREPSMEEILASIRRIIEDSDGGRREPLDTTEPMSAAEAPADDTVADDASAEATAPEVEVFRAELRASADAPVPDAGGNEPKKPISLAEVQAQLASGQPAPAAQEVRGSTDATPARPATLAEVGARVAAEGTAQETPAPAAAAGDEKDATTPAAAVQQDAGVEASADEPQIEIGDDDLVLEEEPLTETAAFRPALVSEQTSRQVAAAFGELSEAFAARGKKSFDEMAEGMLRPMLQDWLDNNLPTLVERLVREEIERVARGGA